MRGSDERCKDHEKGGEKAHGPDEAAPRAQVIGIGWNIKHAGAEIAPSAGGCEVRGGLAKSHDEHGDCEKDEAFEMVFKARPKRAVRADISRLGGRSRADMV